MKTLANCKLSEFLPAAYRLREAFHRYYQLIGVDQLFAMLGPEYREADEKQQKAIKAQCMEQLFRRMMLEHPAETVAIISMCGCMTVEEADALMPQEALGIVMECVRSERVMDFFISLERSAGGGTDGILRLLILLRLNASAAVTSETASQTSTTETNVSESAGDTSESA